MTNKEFVDKLLKAVNCKTLYVMGCFGAPLGYGNNRTRYKNNHSYNKQYSRQHMIDKASGDTFGFDCVCLGKGILWGWNGDKSRIYGGASYASNGVADFGADSTESYCTSWSTDFSNVEIGEWLWMPGHVGYYIGDGLCVECSPAWKNCVQITTVNNIKSGSPGRRWTAHGKIKYLTYEKEDCDMGCPYWINGKCSKDTPVETPATFTVGEVVRLRSDATVYGKTYKFSSWVYNSDLYVREIQGDRVVISTLKSGAITGAVDKKYLIKK